MELLKSLCHRNVVELFASYYSDDRFEVVSIMELCDCDMQQCIDQRQKKHFPYETLMGNLHEQICLLG